MDLGLDGPRNLKGWVGPMKEKAAKSAVTIPALKLKEMKFHIVGTSPYMQHKFSKKAKEKMREKHEAGSTAKKGKKKEPRDFEKDYKEATYIDEQGRYGIPAPCIRNAMISACKVCGFAMTRAKLSVFVEADTYDEDGTALVFIEGTPEQDVRPTRNETGVCDLRSRPRWDNWSAYVRVTFDGDQFTNDDVVNLMVRVGRQVGLGEGRYDGKKSAGIGYGCFKVVLAEEVTREEEDPLKVA